MTCEHKRIKCVNCRFFCIDCGAKVDAPVIAATKVTEEKPKKKGGKAK